METRATNPESTPEDMFLAWFLRLPHACDIATAARQELARLDLTSASEATRRFRIMLEQATFCPPQATPARRRTRH